jgi:hypothetical protein
MACSSRKASASVLRSLSAQIRNPVFHVQGSMPYLLSAGHSPWKTQPGVNAGMGLKPWQLNPQLTMSLQ